jgi:protein phosphatase 2C family protein 2/3
MEDDHVVLLQMPAAGKRRLALAAVFDGHGGKQVAAYCRRVLPMELVSTKGFAHRNFDSAFRQCFHRIDRMIASSMNLSGDDSGCTAVVALIDFTGDALKCHVAHVGDSRAILCRGKEAVQLTKDHKPFDKLERERIESAGGFVNGVGRVNGNLNLSRALGDLKYKRNQLRLPKDQIISAEPDVCECILCEEDSFLLLACDGIFDVMNSGQAIEFVRERLARSEPLQAICEEMLNACLCPDPAKSPRGCDNMSVIVLTFHQGLIGAVYEASTHMPRFNFATFTDNSRPGRLVLAPSADAPSNGKPMPYPPLAPPAHSPLGVAPQPPAEEHAVMPPTPDHAGEGYTGEGTGTQIFGIIPHRIQMHHDSGRGSWRCTQCCVLNDMIKDSCWGCGEAAPL